MNKNTFEPIRLMSNENPFGPSPKALATIKKYKNNIHCYPSWIPETLKEKCAIYNNVSPHNISVSAGSYELINLITSFFLLGRSLPHLEQLTDIERLFTIPGPKTDIIKAILDLSTTSI